MRGAAASSRRSPQVPGPWDAFSNFGDMANQSAGAPAAARGPSWAALRRTRWARPAHARGVNAQGVAAGSAFVGAASTARIAARWSRRSRRSRGSPRDRASTRPPPGHSRPCSQPRRKASHSRTPPPGRSHAPAAQSHGTTRRPAAGRSSQPPGSPRRPPSPCGRCRHCGSEHSGPAVDRRCRGHGPPGAGARTSGGGPYERSPAGAARAATAARHPGQRPRAGARRVLAASAGGPTLTSHSPTPHARATSRRSRRSWGDTRSPPAAHRSAHARQAKALPSASPTAEV